MYFLTLIVAPTTPLGVTGGDATTEVADGTTPAMGDDDTTTDMAGGTTMAATAGAGQVLGSLLYCAIFAVAFLAL